mmetsp:Transcript_12610/g.38033  ORF Transcript_12610/g.38033 Transcript_12610/m.38033 type:complete len:249 (-) Transcript_12610:154-900(-)
MTRTGVFWWTSRSVVAFKTAASPGRSAFSNQTTHTYVLRRAWTSASTAWAAFRSETRKSRTWTRPSRNERARVAASASKRAFSGLTIWRENGRPVPSILTSTSSRPLARNLTSAHAVCSPTTALSTSSTLRESLETVHGDCGIARLSFRYRPTTKRLSRSKRRRTLAGRSVGGPAGPTLGRTCSRNAVRSAGSRTLSRAPLTLAAVYTSSSSSFSTRLLLSSSRGSSRRRRERVGCGRDRRGNASISP